MSCCVLDSWLCSPLRSQWPFLISVLPSLNTSRGDVNMYTQSCARTWWTNLLLCLLLLFHLFLHLLILLYLLLPLLHFLHHFLILLLHLFRSVITSTFFSPGRGSEVQVYIQCTLYVHTHVCCTYTLLRCFDPLQLSGRDMLSKSMAQPSMPE